MSNTTRGEYLHYYVTGERPTKEVLAIYGIAINIPDEILYSLSEDNRVVALPLSKDIIISNYAGHGVPLGDHVGEEVPEAIRQGQVTDLASVFTHIYHSRPVSKFDPVLKKGQTHVAVQYKAGPAKVLVLKRKTVNNVNYVELSSKDAETKLIPLPKLGVDERTYWHVGAAEYRTKVATSYSRAAGSIHNAYTLRSELPEGLDLGDPEIELIFKLDTLNVDVKAAVCSIVLMDSRTGTPLTNEHGSAYQLLSLAVLPLA